MPGAVHLWPASTFDVDPEALIRPLGTDRSLSFGDDRSDVCLRGRMFPWTAWSGDTKKVVDGVEDSE